VYVREGERKKAWQAHKLIGLVSFGAYICRLVRVGLVGLVGLLSIGLDGTRVEQAHAQTCQPYEDESQQKKMYTCIYSAIYANTYNRSAVN
jgi:hypothetical protein